jgi:hypothetical protein
LRLDKIEHLGPVANIQLVVGEIPGLILEPLQIPGGVSPGPQKIGSHVVVDTQNLISCALKIDNRFRSN